MSTIIIHGYYWRYLSGLVSVDVHIWDGEGLVKCRGVESIYPGPICLNGYHPWHPNINDEREVGCRVSGVDESKCTLSDYPTSFIRDTYPPTPPNINDRREVGCRVSGVAESNELCPIIWPHLSVSLNSDSIYKLTYSVSLVGWREIRIWMMGQRWKRELGREVGREVGTW